MTDKTVSKTNGQPEPDQVKIVDLNFTPKELAKTKLTILYNQIVSWTEKATISDVMLRLKKKEELTFPKGGDFKKFFSEKKQLSDNTNAANKMVKDLIGIFKDMQKEYQEMEA